jgi:hypothetical protein
LPDLGEQSAAVAVRKLAVDENNIVSFDGDRFSRHGEIRHSCQYEVMPRKRCPKRFGHFGIVFDQQDFHVAK